MNLGLCTMFATTPHQQLQLQPEPERCQRWHRPETTVPLRAQAAVAAAAIPVDTEVDETAVPGMQSSDQQ